MLIRGMLIRGFLLFLFMAAIIVVICLCIMVISMTASVVSADDKVIYLTLNPCIAAYGTGVPVAPTMLLPPPAGTQVIWTLPVTSGDLRPYFWAPQPAPITSSITDGEVIRAQLFLSNPPVLASTPFVAP
jgi:hypothetical protein